MAPATAVAVSSPAALAIGPYAEDSMMEKERSATQLNNNQGCGKRGLKGFT